MEQEVTLPTRPKDPCDDEQCLNPWHTPGTCYARYVEATLYSPGSAPMLDRDSWEYMAKGLDSLKEA